MDISFSDVTSPVYLGAEPRINHQSKLRLKVISRYPLKGCARPSLQEFLPPVPSAFLFLRRILWGEENLSEPNLYGTADHQPISQIFSRETILILIHLMASSHFPCFHPISIFYPNLIYQLCPTSCVAPTHLTKLRRTRHDFITNFSGHSIHIDSYSKLLPDLPLAYLSWTDLSPSYSCPPSSSSRAMATSIL